jgi:hypothetical protein
MDKRDTQIFLTNIQKLNSQELNRFKSTFAYGYEASWHRFVVGAYNHPLTWWIGIIQLQMQMGIWGFQQRSLATTRANILWQVTKPLRDELKGALQGESIPLISDIVRYNIKYHKADILGRFVGGAFTNYASSGGRLGNKRISGNIKKIRTVTNLGIASYGAAIKAIINGNNSLKEVIQSVLTGNHEHLPNNYKEHNDKPLTSEEIGLANTIEVALSEVMTLTEMSPGPISINEFCLRSENMNLKGICK